MNQRLASATLALALSLGAFAEPSLSSAAEPIGDAERVLDHVTQSVGAIKKSAGTAAASSVTPEERIAAGEILLRNRDWERAIQTFNQVKELHSQGKVAAPALVDAEYLLGEAYFRSNQYLSAKREYLDIAKHATHAPYDIYAGRSISRLVDISLRMNQPATLAELDAIVPTLPTSDASGSLQYARAKYFYAKGDYAKARDAVSQIGATSGYLHQALYLQGVVLTKEARSSLQAASRTEADAKADQTTVSASRAYSAAIEQFKAITRLPADTADRRHVIDLAWLAIARLHYESNNMLDSVDAYSRIGRESPEFSTMLFELAWVYAQLGDYQRAQRSLEVLSITDPQKLELSDGSLLRADLMLRSGQFDKALALYQGVRDRFEPIRNEVDQYIHANSDPAAYYDQLVADVPEASQGQSSKLSPVVVTWVREEAEDNRTLTVIDDVARSRDLVKRSRKLISQLTALLASPTRANAFPELRSAIESALAAANRVSSARLILARGLDSVAQERVPADLAKVRKDRRALMKRLGQLPVLPADFMRRAVASESRWNGLSQQLQRLTLEVDKLQAIINGLSRVMKESDSQGVQIDPAARQRFVAEIQANEQDLNGYRERINGYRDALDMGRVQTGLGDAQYSEDERARRAFKELLTREMELVSRGSDSPEATAFARSAQPVLARAALADEEVDAILRGLEIESAKRAEKLQVTVVHESESIEQNARQLEDLDQQARLLVGEVAMRNFAQVHSRLKGVVLRADVGIVQQAWEVREEQRTRVVNLQRERAREEQNLNDELREVLDDAEGAL
jgi:tetratricopeptide (TPR) repeat protein